MEVEYAKMLNLSGVSLLDIRGLLRGLRRKELMLLQVCDAPMGLAGAVLSRLLRVRMLYDAHEVWPMLGLYESRNLLVGLALVPFYFLSELVAARKAERVITVGEGASELLSNLYGVSPGKIDVVRNVPQADEECHQAPQTIRGEQSTFTVAYAGGLNASRTKSLSNVVRAFALLKGKRNPVYCLKVIGAAGPGQAPPRRLVDLVERLGIRERVSFTGWLPQAEATRQLLEADLGLIPDRKNPCTDISLSNKLFQYIELGLPILSTDLREVRRVLGDRATYYKDDRPESIALSIESACNSYPEALQKARELRTEASQSMTWELEREKYLRAIRSAIATTRQPLDSRTAL